MAEPLQVEQIAIDALGAPERDAWAALRAANPALAHPYFDPRYAEAAAEAPHARLAVLHRGGEIFGLFPFQKRGGLIQPLGAPLSDYHGVIAAPDAAIDLPALTRALGGRALRAGGWMGPATGAARSPRVRMVCDLSGGPEALAAAFEARDHKFCKNMRRNQRGIERDHGPVTFHWEERDPAVLDWIIARKRAQYARTRRHDVFRCGWTARLLHRLLETATPEFGLRVTALRAGDGDIVAAEASLQGDGVLHLWFPAYAEAYRRYGPGTLHVRQQLEAAARAGLKLADFGCGEESYKSTFAEPAGEVLEISCTRPLAAAAARALDHHAPAPVRRFAGSVGRRLDIINACETRPAGWISGALAAAGAAARPRAQGA